MTLRRFGLSACTANPEDLPPSLAQHGSCWRSSTSSALPFQDTRPNALFPRADATPPPARSPWPAAARSPRACANATDSADCPGPAAASASNAPCLATLQMCTTVDRSTLYRSAASRCVACPVNTRDPQLVLLARRQPPPRLPAGHAGIGHLHPPPGRSGAPIPGRVFLQPDVSPSQTHCKPSLGAGVLILSKAAWNPRRFQTLPTLGTPRAAPTTTEEGAPNPCHDDDPITGL